MKFRKVAGGVTAAGGFSAAGISCGIKKQGKKDLALIYSHRSATAAGMFTQNRFQAAPVTVTRSHIATGSARAVIINSGNANACTGEQGLAAARRMAELAAAPLGLAPGEVLVASTGVIGVPLPLEKIAASMSDLVGGLSPAKGLEAAEAILTTDLVTKTTAYQLEIGGRTVTVGGMCKGSGMIRPNMATMLSFITTDCAIAAPLLQKALRHTVERSYNMITVDGDTSTNDMVLVLANGAAGNPAIASENEDYHRFLTVLQRVNTELAQKIVRDGEGATKFLEVTVRHAASFADGKKLALSVLNSSLVKTAFFGEDANWGRIVSALGQTDVPFDPAAVDVFLEGLQVTAQGQGVPFDEAEAAAILARKDIKILIDLHQGAETVTAWGTDLSYEYVRINASYRS
ncbi:MAG TPA: bifunctional glutamate N-acetyltransferase/amino-acid acetyltransferase ArgJ [Firmicutes bacterium]|nr:bifunctional glutamate N-acetyltransferase/amino-acid acetyltransferase ArgJ [Bacillota bacterium]